MSRSLVIAVDSLHRAVGAKDNKNHGDHFEAIVHRDIKPKNIGVLKKNPEGVRLVIKVNQILKSEIIRNNKKLKYVCQLADFGLSLVLLKNSSRGIVRKSEKFMPRTIKKFKKALLRRA